LFCSGPPVGRATPGTDVDASGSAIDQASSTGSSTASSSPETGSGGAVVTTALYRIVAAVSDEVNIYAEVGVTPDGGDDGTTAPLATAAAEPYSVVQIGVTDTAADTSGEHDAYAPTVEPPAPQGP